MIKKHLQPSQEAAPKTMYDSARGWEYVTSPSMEEILDPQTYRAFLSNVRASLPTLFEYGSPGYHRSVSELTDPVIAQYALNKAYAMWTTAGSPGEFSEFVRQRVDESLSDPDKLRPLVEGIDLQ